MDVWKGWFTLGRSDRYRPVRGARHPWPGGRLLELVRASVLQCFSISNLSVLSVLSVLQCFSISNLSVLSVLQY